MLRKSRNRTKNDKSFESLSSTLSVTEEVYQADNQRRIDEAGIVDSENGLILRRH